MADLKYYDVILRPIVTERTTEEMADKKYYFYVHPDSTKTQVSEAVEKMFKGTKVEKVNTINIKGKKKRTRMREYGRTPKRKKAIVKLTASSKDIEIFQSM